MEEFGVEWWQDRIPPGYVRGDEVAVKSVKTDDAPDLVITGWGAVDCPAPQSPHDRVAAIFNAEIALAKDQYERSDHIEWLERFRDRVLTAVGDADSPPSAA